VHFRTTLVFRVEGLNSAAVGKGSIGFGVYAAFMIVTNTHT